MPDRVVVGCQACGGTFEIVRWVAAGVVPCPACQVPIVILLAPIGGEAAPAVEAAPAWTAADRRFLRSIKIAD